MQPDANIPSHVALDEIGQALEFYRERDGRIAQALYQLWLGYKLQAQPQQQPQAAQAPPNTPMPNMNEGMI
jgi:hypothetical protein